MPITIVDIIIALLVVMIVGVFVNASLRQRFITRFIFNVVKNNMPKMSATEKEAIEAGDVWIEADLLQGRLQWENLLSQPMHSFTEEEQFFLDHTVPELNGLFEEWDISETTRDLPANVWTFLKEKGFFGMIIPKEYGGLGFSASAHSAVIQKIVTHSLTAGITAMVPNSLGPGELLMKYGTDEQKAYYLPRLAKGQEIPCFALTSPEAGSDANAITDFGIVCEDVFDGKKTLGIRLTWNKRYITLAPVATVLGLAFKLYDPDRLIGHKESLGITVCLIPTKHKGVEIGHRHFPLYQSFMNGPTRGKDVFVPIDWIIGGTEKAGQGWHMLAECLSAGRGISLPALAGGVSKLAYRTTGAYAAIRKQFKTSIGHFEGVSAVMAQIAGYTYMMEAMRLLTLSALDQQKSPGIVTAMAKYHMTEMGRRVLNHAMDVHGGRSIMLGPNNYLTNAYVAYPIGITVEGANILTRNLIIFGQGVIRCHPYLQSEMKALYETDAAGGLKAFDAVFFKHVRYFIKNKARLLFHGLTAGLFYPAPENTPLKQYYQQLGRMSVALAVISDIALIFLGGKLKRRERLSARLGDVLSFLYMGCAVLKYYHDNHHGKADTHLAQWCLKICLHQIQDAFSNFFNNFNHFGLGKLLRFMVFPYGRPYAKPSDKLDNALTAQMMLPSALRERLTSCVCTQSIAILDEALKEWVRVEPIVAKWELAIKEGRMQRKRNFQDQLKEALKLKIITVEEQTLLEAFELKRQAVISVDEFSHDALSRKTR